MERQSSINKVAGGTQENKENAINKTIEAFLENTWYKNAEREKTIEEIEIIELVIGKINQFLSKYGTEPLKIRLNHIHIMDKDKMPPETISMFDENYSGIAAFFAPINQGIIVLGWKIDSKLELIHAIAHEMIHFISYGTIIANNEDAFETHRTGMEVHSQRGEGSIYFMEINEAITEELNIRFFPELQDLPHITDEYNQVSRLRIEKSDPDISLVLEDDLKEYAYPEYRANLNELIKKIYEKRRSDFGSEEEIFTIFAKAAMTGELRELTTLVESTLGSGTFKKIAKSLSAYIEESEKE